MIALEPGTGTRVCVRGSRELWAEAVASVLEQGGLSVTRDDGRAEPAVLVMIEPASADWAAPPGMPTVVLETREPTAQRLVELVASGAHAVLPTSCEPGSLVRAVQWVAAGESGLSRAQTRLLVDALQAQSRESSERAIELTSPQRDILEAIQDGLSVKQTARHLGISPRTVENTQRLLFRKLGVRNRAEAVGRALGSGLIKPRDGGSSR